jgi:hypothetical protein
VLANLLITVLTQKASYLGATVIVEGPDKD